MAATKATLGVIADDAIGVSQLSATGTASASTYLRGDNAWGAVSSDWVLISTVTASGDTYSDFATLDHTTYSSYQFVIEFTVDTDASHIDMLLAVSGTTYLEGTNYSYIDLGVQRTAGSLSINSNPNMAFIRFGTVTGNGNAADEGFGGVVDCHYFGDANRHALVNCTYSRMDNSGGASNLCWGTASAALLGSTAAITAVRFKANSGTHTGKIKMYGRK